MKAKIQKWGNSLGIRIPIGISKELSLENGSIVDIAEKDNLILIKPMKKRSLTDLLSKVTDENIHDEIGFGKPVGKEIW
jgi:antitoxin MazE